VDECIASITAIKDGITLMIISEAFSPIIVPVVEAISQVSSVYIVCENKAQHEKWVQQWSKLKPSTLKQYFSFSTSMHT
jgi:hypothetical protein